LSTADLHLNTLYVLDAGGRITSTREPGGAHGPLFSLVRSETRCVWAVRADVANGTADELERLARQEPPVSDFRSAPVHADRYVSILENRISAPRQPTVTIRDTSGPAFTFPDSVAQSDDVEIIEDERQLHHNFHGWVAGEIAAGRGPVMGILQDGFPVSICFCARSSNLAAEAGLETAEAFRGRGFGPRVTAAWAVAIRASGRIPLYSTSWTNVASLRVAAKLGLKPYASGWSAWD
jgi:hypothetical protein